MEKEELDRAFGEFQRNLIPEIKRIVDESIDERVSPRFDRLETALDAVAAEVHDLRDELYAVKLR